ncbi:MAG TPA: hypothetical protein VNI20_12275, partial [Fimbriimonadaceae bacterium]|nr:hypothetical protein [Fimbriimonadaceae bacterium]
MRGLRDWWKASKPAWLRTEHMALFGLQLFGTIVIWSLIVGALVGVVHPDFKAIHGHLAIAVFGVAWTIGSVFALVGLFFDRWWAYFLELAVIWSLLLLPIRDVGPEHYKHTTEFLFQPFVDTVTQFLEFVFFIWLCLMLL